MNKMDDNHLPAESAPKKDLVHSAKDFVNGVLSPLKGKDTGQLVEEFTSEMTLVVEGLSEDQVRLQEQADKLSAQQTELEEHLLSRLHDAEVSNQELLEEIDSLKKRLEKTDRLVAEKKIKKVEGFTGLLRQATWLAGILAGAWVITTIIKLFQ